MDIFGTAQSVYRALKDDATAVAALRTERARLALEIATSAKGGTEITSATVNGQSFAGQVSMTKGDRLKLLGTVIAMVDAGGVISRRTGISFQT